MNSVAAVYKWKGFYEPVFKKEITLPDQLLQNYAGIYVYENSFDYILKRTDGYYLFANGTYMKIHFSSETDFFNTENTVEKKIIADSTGTVTGYSRTLKGIPLPEAMKVLNPDTLTGKANFFNNIGWNLLGNKNYLEAIKYLKRGLVLHPNSLLMEGNLAHCFLFGNDYESAIKIYRQHLKESINEVYTWKKMIKEDFAFFKNSNFDAVQMDRVITDLKL